MDRTACLADLAPHGALAVIAPHPDDETLGCGGLIALAAAEGRKVIVVFATDGTASHPGSRRWPPARLARLREREAREALSVLGGVGVLAVPLGLPDGALETVAAGALAATLEGLFRLHAVETVFSPRRDDDHCDHRAAYRAAREAAAAVGARLWCYPIWADTQASGALRLDIAAVLPLKRRAILRHRSQVGGMIGDAEGGFRLTRAERKRFLTTHEPYHPDDGSAAGGSSSASAPPAPRHDAGVSPGR